MVEGSLRFIAFVRFKAFFIENLSVQGVGILRKTPPEWKRWLFFESNGSMPSCRHMRPLLFSALLSKAHSLCMGK